MSPTYLKNKRLRLHDHAMRDVGGLVTDGCLGVHTVRLLATPDECAAHDAAQRHLDATREIAAAHPVPLPTGATDWRAVALEQAKRLREMITMRDTPISFGKITVDANELESIAAALEGKVQK